MTNRDPEVGRMFRSLRDGLTRLNGSAIGAIFPALMLAGFARGEAWWGFVLISVIGFAAVVAVLWQSRDIRRLSSRIEAAINEPLDSSAP